jgi:hypothetical protein
LEDHPRRAITSPTRSTAVTAASLYAASWFDDVKSEYYAAYGEVAADSMIDVSAVNAARPALGEFGVEEADGAEESEAEASEDGAGGIRRRGGQRARDSGGS